MGIHQQQHGRVVWDDIAVVLGPLVQRISPGVERGRGLWWLGKYFLALFFPLLVTQTALALAILVCHELVDDGVQVWFFLAVRPCGSDVIVDGLRVVRFVFVRYAENDVRMWKTPLL